jgi:hypothetical protein
LTTSAVSGLPSWNVTPSRSEMFHCVYSAFGVIDCARNGWKPPSPSGTVSVS